MKSLKISYVILLIAFTTSCSQTSKETYEVGSQMTSEEQKSFLHDISRYVGELPKNGGYETRDEARFDEHYKKQEEQSTLKYYHKDDKTGTEYFLLTQMAPSLQEKYVALGGKLKRNNNKAIEEYEEVFRTWKFPMEQLEPKAEMLFVKLVNGEDLSNYYSDKAGDQYIEFPNQTARYDKNLRRWVTNNNPLDSLYRLRESMP